MKIIDGTKYISEKEFKQAIQIRLNEMSEDRCDGKLTEENVDTVIDQLAIMEAELFERKKGSRKVVSSRERRKVFFEALSGQKGEKDER